MINVYWFDAKTDHLRVLYSRIGKSLETIKAGRKTRQTGGEYSGPERVILIVPAQFTLEAEEAAFELLGGSGFFDLHIMSNNKLAKDIIRETGGMGKTPINSLGRAMLLRRIAKEHESELGIFKSVATDSAFLDMAGDFVLQLKQNNVTLEGLKAIEAELGSDGILPGKLRDMEIFAADYAKAMEGKYNDAEDLRAFVTGRVKDSSFVKGSEIWFYDFYSFTPRDLEFLGELAEYCYSLNISLLMDETGEAYEASRRTLRAIKALTERRNLTFKAESCSIPEFAGKNAEEKHVVRCASPFTMAETIASEVLGLVRDKGYKYSDIAVLTGDDGAAGRTIHRVLELYGIPVFADEKRSVSHSPAVELMSALLSICAEGFKSAHVLSLLKTGLSGFAGTEEINDFENYTKQYHINEERFFKEFKYGKKTVGEEKLAELETLRTKMTGSLLPFVEAFRSATDVSGKTEVLRSYMDSLAVQEKLEASAAELSELGMLDASEELAQISEVISGLLDQFCELLGSETITDEEYKEILESSLKDIKVGLLPQAEGKVLLGNVTRSRTAKIKALFIAGFNEGLIPRGAPAEGILTEYEITLLEERGYVLSKSGTRLMEEDRLVLEKVLSMPEEYLWLGYSLSDSEGQAMKASNLLLDYCEAEMLKEEDDIENSPNALNLIQSPAATLRRLSGAMRAGLNGYDMADEWRAAYNVLRNEGDPRIEAMTAGLLFNNRMKSLGREKAAELYGMSDEAVVSPSRIEKFASCAFKHFISYGLRPDEQREFEISAIEMGTVYHEVLERFCRRLSEPCEAEGISLNDPRSPWMNITENQIEEYVSDAMKQAESDSLDGLLSYGKPQQYHSSRVKKVCVRFAAQLVRQVRIGQIDEMFFETSFGKGRTFPAVEIPTSFGKVRIEGKIDRVDMMNIAGREYVKIVDYKSGSKQFSKEAAEAGLAVQLMVYLEGALGAKTEAKPAGVFYCLIEDPSDVAALDSVDAELAANVIAEHFAKKYRMNGMLLSDETVIRGIDPEALTSEGGTVLALKKTKDDVLKPNAGTELASAEEFDEFREKVRGSIAEICERLSGGEIAADPKRANKKSSLPCEYCDYKAICLRE